MEKLKKYAGYLNGLILVMIVAICIVLVFVGIGIVFMFWAMRSSAGLATVPEFITILTDIFGTSILSVGSSATIGLLIMSMISELLVIGAFLYTLFELHRILKKMKEGIVFWKETPRILVFLGKLNITCGVIQVVAVLILLILMKGSYEGRMDVRSFLLGLGMLVLSEVFRYGAELEAGSNTNLYKSVEEGIQDEGLLP